MNVSITFALLLFFFVSFSAFPMERTVIVQTPNDFAATDLHNAAWRRAKEVVIDRYWSGRPAPAGRSVGVRMLWSKVALYVRFEAAQTEPLVVSNKPDLTKKTIGLWERDVCEIFIAPDRSNPHKYFEFEIAPTGEWIDLAIELEGNKRKTDWEYASGMTSSATIEKGRGLMVIKVPWKAIGKTPKPGDIWLGNLFRCVGEGETRGYLAWSPTLTSEPSFHVPSRFGEFYFAGP